MTVADHQAGGLHVVVIRKSLVMSWTPVTEVRVAERGVRPGRRLRGLRKQDCQPDCRRRMATGRRLERTRSTSAENTSSLYTDIVQASGPVTQYQQPTEP